MSESTGKKQQILEATLGLVNDKGLEGTTIAQISERAGVSPGIIYHYFDSKEELVHTLYEFLEGAFVEQATRDKPLNLPILECYKTIWAAAFTYCVENPKRMAYIEAYQNSGYMKDSTATARRDLLKKLAEKNAESISKGELMDLPIEAIYAMTGRVAVELAKLHLQGINSLRNNSVEELADSVCRSILA
jgi:AcrR family transcriptional regulator